MSLGIRATARNADEPPTTNIGKWANASKHGSVLTIHMVIVHLAVAVVYFAAAKVGLAMAFIGGNVSAVWVPSGLAVAALVLGGLWFAPALGLAAFAATAHTGVSLSVAAGIAVGNTLEYILVWLALRFILHGRDLTLTRVADVLALAGAAVLAPSVAALIGTTSLCLGGIAPWAAFWDVVTTYWLGDTAGILLVGPFLIGWVRARHGARHLPELAAVCVGAAIVSAVVFSNIFHLGADHYVFAYAVFPFLIWGALRHGVPGAATIAVVIAVPAIIATSQGVGLFARPDMTKSLLLLQSFMTVVVLTGLIAAAAISERDAATRRTRLLSHAVEQSATSVMVTDPDGALLYVNPAFTRLTGYPLEEIIGQTPRFLKSGHTPPKDYEALWKAVKAGKTWRGEFLNRTRDGGYIWESATISPVRDPDGTITNLVATKEDITDRKAHEQDMSRALRQSARAKRELERIAYAVTHTLQEPLRAIGGFTQLLEQRYADRLDDQGRNYLGYIRSGTDRMSRLFRDLMDYALIDEPTSPDGPVDLNQAAAAAIGKCRAGSMVTITEPLPTVHGHAGQLRMVFQHLIDNGIAYAKPGIPPEMTISAKPDGNGWRITVRDNGIGIDPAFQGKLFALFSRLHTDEEIAGSGVGLAYCRRVLERHGGRIWLQSAPTEGTAVHLWLPKGQHEPETTEA